MSGELWFWLLAGSNGAGKSTYAPNLPVEKFINPDDIARQLKPDAPEEAALSAGREALRRILDSIKGKRASFAVETTLSGRFHLQAVRDAKRAGWTLALCMWDCEVRIWLYTGLSRELKVEGIAFRWTTCAAAMSEAWKIYPPYINSRTWC